MSPIQLLPIVATLSPLAERLGERLSQGLSFASLLGESHEAVEADLGENLTGGDESSAIQSLAGQDDHLRRFAERELERFIGEFQQRLAAKGVDTGLGFELKSGASGETVVDGNHPRRADIESIFAEDPELQHQFRQVAAGFTSYRRLQNAGEVGSREFLLAFSKGGVPTVRFE